MAKIDVSAYGIRVILNRDLFNRGSSSCPLDVEGTVLFIETQSIYVKRLIKEGNILKILCTYDLALDDASVLVRWDNDVKHWFASGMFVLRSSKLSRCSTIWNNKDIIAESTVHYTELHPDSGTPQKRTYKYHTIDSNSPWASLNKAPKANYEINIPDKVLTTVAPQKYTKKQRHLAQYVNIDYQASEQIVLEISPSARPPKINFGGRIKTSYEEADLALRKKKIMRKAELPTWKEYQDRKVEDNF